MTENIQDLTVEKAKAQIQENTQLKDLGNKTFDDLSANEIQTLGTNVAGTIVLLHKLAGRDGNEKLEAPDVSSGVLSRLPGGLNGKLKAMKLAVEQHDDSLLSVRDNTVTNLYLNHLALDHQKLINTTQTAEKAIVISTTAESDNAAVDIASTNTSQDFKEFMSKIFTNQDLGFKPNKGATPTQKDVERFARIMSVISAAAITTEKTDSKAKTDFKGYDSKNFFTKILPGLGWLPKNERNALEGILKIARDLNATDKAVLQYQLSTIKTVEQYNRYQSIFNTTKTEEGVVSLTADENGSMSEDSADNFHNSDKQVQLLLDTNNSGTLDSKGGDIGSEASLAAMINIAISQYGMKLGDIFLSVTGQPMSEMKGSNILRNQALFQEGLRNAQAVMRSFFGENMNYGLSALMRGNQKEFQDHLRSLPALAKGGKMEINRSIVEKMVDNKGVNFFTKYVLPVVTLVLSGGKYFATLSNDIIHGQSDAGHSVNKDTMMDTIKKNTLHKLPQSAQDLLSTTLSGAGKVLSFADNATTLVNVGSEGNASRVEMQIAAATEKIDKLKTFDELKADPTFGDATKMMMRVMPEATTEQIKIALLANAIDGAFVGNTGSDFTFKLNLAYAAIGYESVTSQAHVTTGNDSVSNQELEATRKNKNLADVTTDLSIESKDGKFEYKLPKNGRINILGTGITGGIPYVVESPKNAEVSKDVVKSTIILESYQVPQVNLEGNGNSLRARITFRDATPAERSVIEKHDKITDDARKKLVGEIIENTRNVSNTETRKADYVAVLKNILENLKKPDEGKINGLLNQSKIKTLLPSGFPSGTDTLSAKVTALESIIAGLSGDQRYRDIRSIVDSLNQDTTTVLTGDDLKKAKYLLTRNITDIKDNNYYTVDEVKNMTPQEITSLFRDMTMDTIQKTFANDKATQGKGEEKNDAFSDKTLEEYGVDPVNLALKKTTYETSLALKKISALGSQSANGVGIEVSHMVKWTGKEKTSTSFSGAKPTTGESMIIGAVDPIEITVNKATFITKLSDVQASMYTSAVREAAWVPQDTKYTPDQIRQALMNSPKIKTTFYYAQSPNCTNATVFMRVSINGRSITPDNVDVATSYSANQVDSRVTKVAAGATVKVLENDTPPENPEQSKSNPSSQTDSQVIDANQVNSANNTTTITPVDTVINSLVDETKTTVIKVGARPK